MTDGWGRSKVKELVGEHGLTVRLDLPQQYRRLAQTVHVEKLKRFTPSQRDWPGRVQGRKRLPAIEQEDGEYEIERVIGKRVTFEDVQEGKGEEKGEALANPFQLLKVDEDEEKEPSLDIEEGAYESKYDEEEVKEREEPVRRVTRAATRAAEVSRHGRRQVVSAQALRLKRAGGNTTTQGKEKREVVWYLVQWKGYSDEHNSWVRAEDMRADEAIAEYEERQRRGDDLGVHYLHCQEMDVDQAVWRMDTRVVGDWS